jgi:hypothetical protein
MFRALRKPSLKKQGQHPAPKDDAQEEKNLYPGIVLNRRGL